MIEIKPGGAGYVDGNFNGTLEAFEDGNFFARVTGDFAMTEGQAAIFKAYVDGFLLSHKLTFPTRAAATAFTKNAVEHLFKLGEETNKGKAK